MAWIVTHIGTISLFVLLLTAAGSSALALHEMKKSAQLELVAKSAISTVKENQKETVNHAKLQQKIYSLPDAALDKRFDRWVR